MGPVRFGCKIAARYSTMRMTINIRAALRIARSYFRPYISAASLYGLRFGLGPSQNENPCY